jgi:hypothetical protein
MSQADETLDVLREVVGVLDRIGIQYALGGSIASAYYGESRSTRDADLSVEPFPGREREFVESFGPPYYVSEGAVVEAIRRRSTFNLIQTELAFKVDFFVRSERPFASSVMQRRSAIAFPGHPQDSLSIVSVEDVILLKLEWYRLGNEVSDRQWGDVQGVLRIQRGRLDWAYLEHWAAELGVADLLTTARNQADEDA